MNDVLFTGLNELRQRFDLSYRERKSLEECLSRELVAPRIRTYRGFSNRIHRVLVALRRSRLQRKLAHFDFDAAEHAMNNLLWQQKKGVCAA